MKPFRALSLGGGQVSTALVIAIADKLVVNGYDFGALPLDACTFADTGGELDATYRHIDRLRDYLAARGVRLDVVRARGVNLMTRVLMRVGGKVASAPQIPFHLKGSADGRAMQGCTRDYKGRPIDRHVKRLATAAGKRHDVEVIIGFGSDEADRVRNDTPVGWPKGWRWRYPLIEAGVGRGWCIDVCIAALGRTLPVPSACAFCPHRPDVGPASRAWIKENEPETWKSVVAFDAAIRNGYGGMNAQCFVSAMRVPVEDAVRIGLAQGELWPSCGRENGRCFT